MKKNLTQISRKMRGTTIAVLCVYRIYPTTFRLYTATYLICSFMYNAVYAPPPFPNRFFFKHFMCSAWDCGGLTYIPGQAVWDFV